MPGQWSLSHCIHDGMSWLLEKTGSKPLKLWALRSLTVSSRMGKLERILSSPWVFPFLSHYYFLHQEHPWSWSLVRNGRGHSWAWAFLSLVSLTSFPFFFSLGLGMSASASEISLVFISVFFLHWLFSPQGTPFLLGCFAFRSTVGLRLILLGLVGFSRIHINLRRPFLFHCFCSGGTSLFHSFRCFFCLRFWLLLSTFPPACVGSISLLSSALSSPYLDALGSFLVFFSVSYPGLPVPQLCAKERERQSSLLLVIHSASLNNFFPWKEMMLTSPAISVRISTTLKTRHDKGTVLLPCHVQYFLVAGSMVVSFRPNHYGGKLGSF